MNDDNPELTLKEAANRFLTDLSADDKEINQQTINKFIRWFGVERSLAGIKPPEIDNYAEGLSKSATDYLDKLEIVKTFLNYTKKKGWVKTNLAVHLKAKKGKPKLQSKQRRNILEPVYLTQQGHVDLKVELADLKRKSIEIIADITKAAADKDFRENAPLQAAKEQRGHLEGRIMELEATLKAAVIMDEQGDITSKVNIGDNVILYDLDSGKEMRYTLVSTKEVDPLNGKISTVSPIGKAVIGKEQEEIVEVAVPAGKRRYQIKQIEH
ncbi:GreA/GreB family elongation factor [Chloroflexota bacterium]